MKYTLLNISLAFAAVFTINTAAAQTEHRYTINPAVSVDKEFTETITAGVEAEANFCNATSSKDFAIKPFIEYQPLKFLTLAAEYRFKYEDEAGETAWQRRLGLSVKGKYGFEHFKFDCRLKYTLYNEDYDDDSKRQYFRTRFGAQYKIKPIKLTPYVNYEWFYNIPRGLVDRDRWTFGVKKKLNKQSTIGVEYQLDEHFNRVNAKRTKYKNDIAEHVFCFYYEYSF